MMIAVDTGGTKTLVGLFTRAGKLEKMIKFPTPRNIPKYIVELRIAIAELVGEKTPDSITVALPGLIAEDGTLVRAPNLGWLNVHIGQLLNNYYDCPVLIENDANLAAVGEAHALRATPHICLYVTFSTGIGTGLVIDGNLTKTFSRGEGGHAMLEYDGVIRDWETFASGAAIYKVYGKYGSEITSRKVWHQIADRFSRGLLAHIPLIQPDVVIIGGSMGAYFDKYGDVLERLLDEKLPPRIVSRPKIVQATHPEEAVIYGCYYYARSQFTN